MKRSIWQQFSSNHSASFQAVGEFKAIEEASVAVELLRSILLRIHDWRNKNPKTEGSGGNGWLCAFTRTGSQQ
jgi:hypothetical protein